MPAPVPSTPATISNTVTLRNAFQAGITYSGPGEWNINGMLFDAWLRLNHSTSLTITQHPVEIGATIADHAYNNPRRFSFDLGMSDTILASTLIQSFQNTYSRAANTINALQTQDINTLLDPVAARLNSINTPVQQPSRSINAYNALVQMQQSRDLLTLTSKYGDYTNVLIESIEAADDSDTQQALKMTVNLVEVILATTQAVKVSANPHATDQTKRGNVAPVRLGSKEFLDAAWARVQNNPIIRSHFGL